MSWSSLPFHCSKYCPCSYEGCRPKDSTVPRSRGEPQQLSSSNRSFLWSQLDSAAENPGRIHKTRPGYNMLVYIEALISTPPSPGPYSKKIYRNNDQINPASFKSPNWHKVTGFSRRSGSKERQMLEVLAVQFHSLATTQAWTKCFISQKKKIKKIKKSHWNCCFSNFTSCTKTPNLPALGM